MPDHHLSRTRPHQSTDERNVNFISFFLLLFTIKILLETWAFILIITFYGEVVGPLLEATSARKVIKTSFSKGRQLEMLVSRSL